MDKAAWDRETTEVLIKECLEQIIKKARNNASFKKKGWKEIEAGFNAKTGKKYDNKQLRNRLDTLKREWSKWEALCKETGVGWDPKTNTVVAPNEWWEKKIKVLNC